MNYAEVSILLVQLIYFLMKVKRLIPTPICGTSFSRAFEAWATCMPSCFAATEALVLASDPPMSLTIECDLHMSLTSASVSAYFRLLRLLLEILKWTAGHIGGIEYLLNSTRRKNSASMRGGTVYELTNFYDDHTPSEVGRGFRYSPGGRGLPELDHLERDPSMTAMFRQLLRDGQLFDDESRFRDAVVRAHKSGYIYAEILGPSHKEGFVIPTPLHTVSLSWILVMLAQVDLPSDLKTLVWEVVGRFNFSQLNLPIRRAGLETTSDLPRGAQYQDEFFRALLDFTKGGVLVSPEFASGSGSFVAGRIDFYISSKKWGIEITRDGEKLQEHSDRFGTSGAHGRWLASGEMSDYILLDCRSTRPIKPHSGIPNLFHAVFDRDGHNVTIYNNSCEEVTMAFLETL